jgi:hypothetical protein
MRDAIEAKGQRRLMLVAVGLLAVAGGGAVATGTGRAGVGRAGLALLGTGRWVGPLASPDLSGAQFQFR